MLLTHWVVRALARAFSRAGNNIAARTAMMAMTTSNSIKVKARRREIAHSRVFTFIWTEDR